MTEPDEVRLLQAAADGTLPVLIKCLQNGASIEQKDQNGQTALMVSSERGHYDIVSQLLRYKADVNAKDEDGWSALIAASKEGHAGVAGILLEHGAKVAVADLGGWTPLVWASYKGHFETVEQLLRFSANPNERGQHNMTALIWAAGRGHWKVVKQLINAGAQADVSDKYGTSALVWACRKGHSDVVRILLAEDANVQTAGTHGWTPLIMATKGGYQDVVELLLEHQANVNAIDQDGRSALSWASKEGHASIVRVLLNHGVYINMPDKQGETALMTASKEGHASVVEILVEKFADLEYADPDGKTPLYYAVEKGHVDAVRELLNAGADPQVTNKDGETPLLRGAKKKHTHCVQLLLEKGAQITATDKKGDTALHIAVRNRFSGLCEVLLRDPKNNRLLYKPNKAGETPYSIDCSLKQSVITPLFGNKALHADPTKMELPDSQESFLTALADFIGEPSLSLPLTVGLYSKWGAGKSLFLQKLQDHLTEFQQQYISTPFHVSAGVTVFALVLSLTIGFITWASMSRVSGIAAGSVVFIVLISIFLLARSTSRSPERSIHRFGMRLTRSLRRVAIFVRLVYCVAPSTESVRQMLPVHYITVDMSRVIVMADTPMQSLLNFAKELSDLTERDIGMLFPRLFRVFRSAPYRSSNPTDMDLRPRWKATCCCVPGIVFTTVFFLVLWTGLACFAMYGKAGNKIVTGIEIASSCIVGGAILCTIPRILVVIYSVALSLKKRISIVASQSGMREDTFLHVLKQEIDLYVEMLECFDGFSRQQTRVIVSLDLLDSLEQQKVLQLVNSLNHLLAEAGHPFVAVFTLDPRLLVKAVDQSLASLQESHVTAYDYLRNLVDLPCYVPEQSKSPVCGLVPPSIMAHVGDVSVTDNEDADLEWDGELTDFSPNGPDVDEQCNGKAPLLAGGNLNSDACGVRFSSESIPRMRDGHSRQGAPQSSNGDDKGAPRISTDLTQFMRDNEGGTLSDIRRTMNIVSLTARLLRARGLYFRWRALASWVSLADGWPYKITWLSLLSEDSSFAAPQNLSIKRLYALAGGAMPVVGDPEIGADNELVYFETFIANHHPMLTVKDMRIFGPCTFHVDPTIRKMMVEYLQAAKAGTITKQMTATTVTDGQMPMSPSTRSLPWTPIADQLDPGPCLSQLTVEDICKQLSLLDGIQSEDIPKYEARLRECNINGKVLANCDVQELRDAMQMKFGDWQLFKTWLLQCKANDADARMMISGNCDVMGGSNCQLLPSASMDAPSVAPAIHTKASAPTHHPPPLKAAAIHQLDNVSNHSLRSSTHSREAVVIENEAALPSVLYGSTISHSQGSLKSNRGSSRSTQSSVRSTTGSIVRVNHGSTRSSQGSRARAATYSKQRQPVAMTPDQWAQATGGYLVGDSVESTVPVSHGNKASNGSATRSNGAPLMQASGDSGFSSADHQWKLLSRQRSLQENQDFEPLSSISSSQSDIASSREIQHKHQQQPNGDAAVDVDDGPTNEHSTTTAAPADVALPARPTNEVTDDGQKTFSPSNAGHSHLRTVDVPPAIQAVDDCAVGGMERSMDCNSQLRGTHPRAKHKSRGNSGVGRRRVGSVTYQGREPSEMIGATDGDPSRGQQLATSMAAGDVHQWQREDASDGVCESGSDGQTVYSDAQEYSDAQAYCSRCSDNTCDGCMDAIVMSLEREGEGRLHANEDTLICRQDDRVVSSKSRRSVVQSFSSAEYIGLPPPPEDLLRDSTDSSVKSAAHLSDDFSPSPFTPSPLPPSPTDSPSMSRTDSPTTPVRHMNRMSSAKGRKSNGYEIHPSPEKETAL